MIDPRRVSSRIPRTSVASSSTTIDPGDVGDRPNADRGLVRSLTSRRAPFATLFDALDLTAEVRYNFYTPDERTNDREEVAGRSADALPRCVVLRWRRAPDVVVQSPSAPTVTGRPPTPAPIRGSMPVAGALVDLGMKTEIDLAVVNLITEIVEGGTATAALDPSTVEPIRAEAAAEAEETVFLVEPPADTSSFIELIERTADEAELVASSIDGVVVSRRDGSVKSLVGSSPALSYDAVVARTGARTSSTTIAATSRSVDTSIIATFVEPPVGSIDPTAVDGATRPEHIESIEGAASVVVDMVAAAAALPSSPVAALIPTVSADVGAPDGTEYIGYVLEKYRQGSTGFTLVETVNIDGRSIVSFIDPKVVFGGVYRYRVKSIIRWVRSGLVRYADSEWCRRWVYASIVDGVPPDPPDHVVVRPISRERCVEVTWRVPWDPQLDHAGFRLWRRAVDAQSRPLDGWSEVGRYPVANGRVRVPLAIDDDRFHVFSLTTVTLHDEESLLSEQFGARLNRRWRELGEHPVKQLSQPGASRTPTPTVLPRILRVEEPAARRRVAAFGRVGDHPGQPPDIVYVLRVVSDDTGERRDVRILVDYRERPPVVVERVVVEQGPTIEPTAPVVVPIVEPIIEPIRAGR